jgi:hypothetical protein
MAFRVSRGRRNSSFWTVAGIIGLILVIAASGAVVVYKFVKGPADSQDAATLCPANGPKGHVVLLVDKSDPLTFTQRKDFEVVFRNVIATAVPRGHLLSVYALTDDFKSTAEPLIELCNPGDGRDLGKFDGNPDMQRDDYREKYEAPLLAVRQMLVTDVPGKASPILEMVQMAGITGFGRRAVSGPRRLIVVSDFIQNTPDLPMYKVGVPAYDAFRATPYGRKVAADLKDVKVELRMLLNRQDLQNEKLLKFWQAYVDDAGGRVVTYDPVRG